MVVLVDIERKTNNMSIAQALFDAALCAPHALPDAKKLLTSFAMSRAEAQSMLDVKAGASE